MPRGEDSYPLGTPSNAKSFVTEVGYDFPHILLEFSTRDATFL